MKTSSPKTPAAERTDSASRRRPRAAWVFAIPFVGVLWVPFYARTNPRIAGIPFFVWYQILFVLVSAAVVAAVFLVQRPARDRSK